MNPLKNKIEELKKEIERVKKLRKEANDGEWNFNQRTKYILNLKAKLQAYEEAQKLMDETLKNIIDEIDVNKFTSQEVINFINKQNQRESWISLKDIKQIIQKHGAKNGN